MLITLYCSFYRPHALPSLLQGELWPLPVRSTGHMHGPARKMREEKAGRCGCPGAGLCLPGAAVAGDHPKVVREGELGEVEEKHGFVMGGWARATHKPTALAAAGRPGCLEIERVLRCCGQQLGRGARAQ